MTNKTTKHRNTRSLVSLASEGIQQASAKELMHVTLNERHGKQVTLPDGRKVTEFINCSYLGLDLHPEVIAAGQRVLEEWGVHFCCARSRFSIGPNQALEEGLSTLFRGRAITFPSVTTTHMSVLPLLASGVLLPSTDKPVHIIFDRFAHSSMQYLKPILAQEATLSVIPHNDLDALYQQTKEAQADGKQALYLADGVYSMGGHCPIDRLLPMAQELDLALYIDDAHGTSIYGEQGEGYVLSQIEGPLPPNVFVNFSLAKGFGCNGGGIVVPDKWTETQIRHFGQTYSFSAPLDFSLIGAALAALELHLDGTVKQKQEQLQRNIRTFVYGETETPQADDPMLSLLASTDKEHAGTEWLGPIRMVFVGDTDRLLQWGERLVERGYFATTAFFPVVGRGKGQLRIAITADHTREEILGLRHTLNECRQTL